MLDRLNPIPIIIAYVSPFKSDGSTASSRSIDFWHISLFVIVPAVLGVFTWRFLGALPGKAEDISLYIATMSILAAVMTGLLPIVHGVLGQTQTADYKPPDEDSRKNELRRVETLRELYSAICFSVIVLVVGILALMGLAFADSQLPSEIWLQDILSAMIYIISAISIAAFVNIATGVYDALEHQAKCVTDKLDAARKPLVAPLVGEDDSDDAKSGSPESDA